VSKKTYTIKWLSDIHLNFYREKEERIDLYKSINRGSFDSIIITGDIAESETLHEVLLELSENITKDVYFVLGNHDFYGGSVDSSSTIAEEFSLFVDERICYLPDHSYVALNKELGLCLVGENGWADGRNGSGIDSYVSLNDQYYIEDLNEAYGNGYRSELFRKMQQLADWDADSLNDKLMSLPKWCTKLIVATHIPPFTETSRYRGKPPSPDFLPFYSSQILGDTLKTFAEKHPHIQILSISGHTHGGGKAQILPNLVAKTHNSDYFNLKAKLLRFKSDEE